MTSRTETSRWAGAANRGSEDPEIMVKFSPRVVSRLKQIEALVRDSEHFDSDILLNLQGYLRGKPMPLSRAVSGVAFVTRHAMRHVNATGDREAENAVVDLLEALSIGNSPCVIPVEKLGQKR